MAGDQIHNCDEEELGAMLHRLLIVEGHTEVVIQHPTDGEQVVTKESFLEMQRHIKRANDMSPAERLVENKRLKMKKQMQFRTAMIEAEFYTVDLNDDENFGFDVDGNKLDIDGLIFTPVDQYLPGIDIKEKEIGAFVDEAMAKPPIRILAIEPLLKEDV